MELQGKCLVEAPFSGKIDLLLDLETLAIRKGDETPFGIGNSIKSVSQRSVWRRTPTEMHLLHRSTTADLENVSQPMTLVRSHGDITSMNQSLGFERTSASRVSDLNGPRSVSQLLDAAISGRKSPELGGAVLDTSSAKIWEKEAAREDAFMAERDAFLEEGRDKIREISTFNREQNENEELLLRTYISALMAPRDPPKAGEKWRGQSLISWGPSHHKLIKKF